MPSLINKQENDVRGDTFTIQVPPVKEPFYGCSQTLAYFGFSQRGKSHIDSGTQCQDRCFSRYIAEKDLLVVAIADGVGSCTLSDLGADVAVHNSVDFICGELQKVDAEKIDSQLIEAILPDAMQCAFDQVELAANSYKQLLYSLQSTLTIAVYDGANLCFGHAGDDGIIVLKKDGSLQLATNRHKGKESNSVYPLQSRGTWQFGSVSDVVAFVMVTDGVLDDFIQNSPEYERLSYQIVEGIFKSSYNGENSVKRTCDQVFSQMSKRNYRSVVEDDITIVVGVNSDALSRCPCEPVVPSENAYDEEKQSEQNCEKSEIHALAENKAQRPNYDTAYNERQSQTGGHSSQSTSNDKKDDFNKSKEAVENKKTRRSSNNKRVRNRKKDEIARLRFLFFFLLIVLLIELVLLVHINVMK